MIRLRTLVPVLPLLLPLAACGGGSSSPDAAAPDATVADAGPDASVPDANPDPFFCAGKPLPTTAPATVVVSGSTEQITLGGATPLDGVVVTAYDGGGSSIATATSDTAGAYAVSLTTGGAPLDGYLVGHKDGGSSTYMDTYLYPPAPLAADTAQGRILMLTSGSGGTFGTLQSLAGVTQAPGKAFIGVVIADCNYQPIAGATIVSPPAGSTVIYSSGGLPSSSATSTATDGLAYIFNVPPGTVTINANTGTMDLRAHDLDARADVITTTAVQP